MSESKESKSRTNDMSSVLQKTTSSIEQAMKELYDLQTAIINANGGNTLDSSRKFTEIRRSLKEQWEAIAQLLKKIHSFGDDITLLKANVTEADHGDLVEVLEAVISKGRECSGISGSLFDGHETVMGPYHSYKGDFSQELAHPKYHVDPRQMFQGPVRKINRAGDSTSKWYKLNHPAPQPGRDYEQESTANFRNESIGSLYPDGARAMSLFQESTAKIHEQLELFEAIMSDQSTVCDNCLEGMKTSADRRTVKAAQDLASRWLVYTGETMKTIKAITKVCDAIMIEAVGAPKAPEPSLGIGYNDRSEGTSPELGQSLKGYISIDIKGYVPASLKFW